MLLRYYYDVITTYYFEDNLYSSVGAQFLGVNIDCFTNTIIFNVIWLSFIWLSQKELKEIFKIFKSYF